MTFARPRLLGVRTLAISAVSSIVAVAVLALSSGDALVNRSFETAFAATSPTAPITLTTGSEGAATKPSSDLWLTRHDGTPVDNSKSHARIGERITMAIDGGQPVELEVIAVTEITTPIIATSGTASRLVMVTCREIGREAGKEASARIVRVILDSDEPLSGFAAAGPARAL